MSAGDAILEFWEVACHNLLYSRGVYPESAFEWRKAYGGLNARRCRVPAVAEYVSKVLSRAQELLNLNQVRGVAILFRRVRDNGLLERVLFEITPSFADSGAASTRGTLEVNDIRNRLRSMLVSIMRNKPPDAVRAEWAARGGRGVQFEMQIKVDQVDLSTLDDSWATVNDSAWQPPGGTQQESNHTVFGIHTASLSFCTLPVNSERLDVK